MADTKIDWADKVWNPIAGCTKCSPGCLNCYAEVMAKRLYWMGMEEPATRPEYMKFKDGWKDGHIELCEHRLEQPLHWRKPRRIFVCSMSDLFHPKVPREFIAKVLDIAVKAYIDRGHTSLFLTKRPKRMGKEFITWSIARGNNMSGIYGFHIGVSISTQAEADEKIPILLQIPAAVRYVSLEPLIDWINIIDIGGANKLDWIIVGCESGPKRRWCNIRWVQSIVGQCKAANVPVFVKQINQGGKIVKMPEMFPQEYPRT